MFVQRGFWTMSNAFPTYPASPETHNHLNPLPQAWRKETGPVLQR